MDTTITIDTLSPGRVLVVDDDRMVTRVFERLLGKEGYEVEIVHDGLAALQAIDVRPPDLVVLDVIMPGLDGFELCRRLKQNQATRLLPVVLVTGHDDRGKRIEGVNAGADDFLSK